MNTWVERKSRIAESFAKRVLRMTRAQNRGARFRRELGLHGLVDAGTAANRPNLEAWVSPFRALSSLLWGKEKGKFEHIELIALPYGRGTI